MDDLISRQEEKMAEYVPKFDFRSELCKSCIHTKVCMKEKNLFGDVFVAGNPMIFDNAKQYERFEERKAKGFPCEDYFSVVRCKDCKYRNTENGFCDKGERREE